MQIAQTHPGEGHLWTSCPASTAAGHLTAFPAPVSTHKAGAQAGRARGEAGSGGEGGAGGAAGTPDGS